MDKLWLSSSEKKRYNAIYKKLYENKYLQKERLIKFATSKTLVPMNQAKILVDKAFTVSKERDLIDQVGFFYLLKYIAHIQNGGSEDDDITDIQRDLPLPAIKDTKKSSDSSEKSSSHSKKSSSHSQNHSKMNGHGDEEHKENGNHEQVENNSLIDKNIIMSLNNNSQLNNQDENGIENESSLQFNLSALQESNISANQSSVFIDSNIFQEPSKIREAQQGQIVEEEEQEEQKENFNQPQEDSETQSKVQAISVLEIDNASNKSKESYLNQEAEMNQLKGEQQKQEPQNNNPVEQPQGVEPEFSLSKIRCMTFGQQQIEQLQKLINEDKQIQQQQEKNAVSEIVQPKRNSQEFGEKNTLIQEPQQIIDNKEFRQEEQSHHRLSFGQKQNSIPINSNSFGQFQNVQEQLSPSNTSNSLTFGQGSKSLQPKSTSENLTFGQAQKNKSDIHQLKEQLLQNQQVNNDFKGEEGSFSFENCGNNEINVSEDTQKKIEQNKQDFFNKFNNNIFSDKNNNPSENRPLNGNKVATQFCGSDIYVPDQELVSNNMNNKTTDDSVYEQQQHQQQQQQQQQSIPANLNKYPLLIKKEESYFVSQNGNNGNYNEENTQLETEEEEQQLIKSVSQVFQKDDQNQIKNAFDFFKSNREESQLYKSKIRKEKNSKRVQITSYRDEQQNFFKSFTLYTVETIVDGKKFTVDRRYNNFRSLHDYFENSVDYYGIIKPTLPSKNIGNVGSYLGSNYMDQQIIEQRKIDLENYLNLYLQNEILKNDKVLTSFLEEKEFNPPADSQFSYVGWMKKMVTNVQITDFSELKEYTEAKMKITLSEFFKLGDSEVDTKDIDEKIVKISQLGNLVNKVISFLNDDIKYDTEQSIAVEQLEKNFYTQYDQCESQQERQRDSLQETLKKFKSETLDLSQKVKAEIQEKVKVLQQFRLIHNSIESAKVAQQVLKNKIQERFILKNMKLSKFNKVHEQNNNKSDSSEAKRELEKLNEKFQQSEDIIQQIQDKLSKELSTFIENQRIKVNEALNTFNEMQKQYQIKLQQ